MAPFLCLYHRLHIARIWCLRRRDIKKKSRVLPANASIARVGGHVKCWNLLRGCMMGAQVRIMRTSGGVARLWASD